MYISHNTTNQAARNLPIISAQRKCVYTAYETRRHGFRFIGSIYYDECLFEFIECLSKINTNNVLKEIKIAKKCWDENLSY